VVQPDRAPARACRAKRSGARARRGEGGAPLMRSAGFYSDPDQTKLSVTCKHRAGRRALTASSLSLMASRSAAICFGTAVLQKPVMRLKPPNVMIGITPGRAGRIVSAMPREALLRAAHGCRCPGAHRDGALCLGDRHRPSLAITLAAASWRREDHHWPCDPCCTFLAANTLTSSLPHRGHTQLACVAMHAALCTRPGSPF